ncbi:hypothetical protein SNEBB_010856 [Seison nebaliae]|nr:hypothetical protein SNEBB_010856 [Seison nebaliae]
MLLTSRQNINTSNDERNDRMEHRGKHYEEEANNEVEANDIEVTTNKEVSNNEKEANDEATKPVNDLSLAKEKIMIKRMAKQFTKLVNKNMKALEDNIVLVNNKAEELSKNEDRIWEEIRKSRNSQHVKEVVSGMLTIQETNRIPASLLHPKEIPMLCAIWRLEKTALCKQISLFYDIVKGHIVQVNKENWTISILVVIPIILETAGAVRYEVSNAGKNRQQLYHIENDHCIKTNIVTICHDMALENATKAECVYGLLGGKNDHNDTACVEKCQPYEATTFIKQSELNMVISSNQKITIEKETKFHNYTTVELDPPANYFTRIKETTIVKGPDGEIMVARHSNKAVTPWKAEKPAIIRPKNDTSFKKIYEINSIPYKWSHVDHHLKKSGALVVTSIVSSTLLIIVFIGLKACRKIITGEKTMERIKNAYLQQDTQTAMTPV